MKPNDFGKKILTDQCQQLKLNDFIVQVKQDLKKALLQSSIETNGYQITLISSKTGFGGTRYWFSCPACQKRVGVLYKHPITEMIGCRVCLGLDYRKRRFKGMTENI